MSVVTAEPTALDPILDSDLSNIERDRGFFLEHGRLAGARTKQITREVNDLCDAVSRQASVLVDASGIPDQVLAALIGLAEPSLECAGRGPRLTGS